MDDHFDAFEQFAMSGCTPLTGETVKPFRFSVRSTEWIRGVLRAQRLTLLAIMVTTIVEHRWFFQHQSFLFLAGMTAVILLVLDRSLWAAPQDWCPALLKLCNTHPDLAEFRRLVIAQGRPFHRYEVSAMASWYWAERRRQEQRVKAEQDKQACVELYSEIEQRDQPTNADGCQCYQCQLNSEQEPIKVQSCPLCQTDSCPHAIDHENDCRSQLPLTPSL